MSDAVLNATPEQIDNEIKRIGYALAHKLFTTNQELGAFGINYPDPLTAPLADLIRDVFAHAAGEREVDEVDEQCQTLGEMLWCPPTEAFYEIPAAFWQTLLGQAIVVCIGDVSSLTDTQEVTSAQAGRIAGVSKRTIIRATASGDLLPARRIGPNAIYTVGAVKAWARGRTSEE